MENVDTSSHFARADECDGRTDRQVQHKYRIAIALSWNASLTSTILYVAAAQSLLMTDYFQGGAF